MLPAWTTLLGRVTQFYASKRIRMPTQGSWLSIAIRNGLVEILDSSWRSMHFPSKSTCQAFSWIMIKLRLGI